MEKKTIAVLNRPNSNHRIYTRESFKNIPEKVPVTNGPAPLEDSDLLSHTIGEASNFEFEGDCLMADISLMVDIPTKKLSFAISGEGDLVHGGSPHIESELDATVIDYSLKSVSCIPKEENAFQLSMKECDTCEFDTDGDGNCANSKNCLENGRAFWLAKTVQEPGKIYDPKTCEFVDATEENRKRILKDFEDLLTAYVKACPTNPKKETP